MEIALIVVLVILAVAVLALIVALLRAKHADASPMDARLDSLNRGLGDLASDTRRMLEVGEDMRKVLGAPTLRGGMGERMLEQLLRQVLPKGRYATQHQFRNGNRVDAIIHLPEGQVVSVDAKFPMESFRRLVEADEAERATHRKQLHRAVRRHGDDIANKYIVSGETLDFAIMYIPAENVYYEVVENGEDKEDIVAYAWNKRVFLTSPNSFYAYLNIVTLGLTGLQVAKSSEQTLATLGRLKRDLEKFADDYRVLGNHLRNAQSKYDDGWPRLQSIQGGWPGQLTGDTPEELEPEDAEDSSQTAMWEDERQPSA